MEKTGNSVQLKDSEKKILKKLIDRKYGKLTTSIDFESTGGLHDYGIEADIFTRIGNTLSGSTIERIVGLTKEHRKIRISSLEILSEYLDFKNVNQLLYYIESNSLKTTIEGAAFDISNFIKNHIIKITFGDNKEISIRYLETTMFDVVFSRNSKLLKGDRIEIKLLELGEELVLGSVHRIKEKKTDNLGPYKSGENNKVKSIILGK
jgi:hypothetical protein